MNMNKRRQLPLPDDTAPKPRKPVPPLPVGDDTPPPPLPSRGGPGGPPSLPNRRPQPPEPQKLPSRDPLDSVASNDSIEDTYADADAGEVYAECDIEDQQENYDDFSVEPDEPQQEVYDEFEVEDEPQEEYDEFAVGDEEQTYEVGADCVQDVYEAVEDNAPPPPALPPSRGVKGKPPPPAPSTPSPPPPPPPAVKRQEKVDLPKPSKTNKPPIASKAGLDLNELLNRRNKLKSVSLEDQNQSPTSPAEPKEYMDNMDVKSRLQMFKQKEAGLASPGRKFNITNGKSFDKTDSPKTPKLPEPPKLASEAETSKRAALPPIPTDDSLPPPPPPDNRSGQKADLPPPPVKDSYTKVQPKNLTTPTLNQNNQAGWPDDYDQEEIYDDAITGNADPLMQHPWYFGMLDRDKGNTLIKKVGKNGTYLLRKSNKGGSDQPYTLMVLFNSHVYNLKIRLRRDGKYALGEEKPDEITFDEVDGLIEHHQTNDVILVSRSAGNQSKTLLLHIPD